MRFLAGTLLTLATASLLVAQQSVAPGAASVPASPPTAGQTNSQAQQPRQDSSASDVAAPPPSQQPVVPEQATSTPAAGASPAPAAEQTGAASIAPLGTPLVPTVSHREAAEAKRQFQAGVKLKSKGHLDAAFDKFSSASELDPRNIDYITAREFTRQELAMQALKQGNQAMLEQQRDCRHGRLPARAGIRSHQRLRAAAAARLHARDRASQPKQSAWSSSRCPSSCSPPRKHQDFHFRGDSRALLTQVARAYGITRRSSTIRCKQQRVHFDIQDVNFATAMEAANAVTKTFWVPLSAKQICSADRHGREPSQLRAHGTADFLSARADRPATDGDDQLAARAAESALHLARTRRSRRSPFAPNCRCWRPPTA